MARTLVRAGGAAAPATPTQSATTPQPSMAPPAGSTISTVVKVVSGVNGPAPAPAPAAGTADADARLIHGAASATLVYGDTGSGKTTLLATYARWVWKKFKVPTRLYAFDPGGYSDDVLALIKIGIIEIWRAYTRDPLGELGLPSETLQRACQGWWPVEIDPASGESPVGVKILSPEPGQRFAVAYDGLTSMQAWSMDDMGQRSAKGTLGGEGANMKTIESGDMKMGQGNRASVGFTQNKCRNWVLSSLSIPNLVCPPVFTALELKVLDFDTKLPLYGSKIAGQAKTDEVPSWFGATLGTCIARDTKNRPQWRLYLRDYCWPPNDNTPHKAKIRASATLPELASAETAAIKRLPEYLADEADIDKPLTKFNLGHLFDLLEQVRRSTLDAAAAEFPDAPGLKASTIGQAPAARRTLPGAAPAAGVAVTGLRRASAPAVVAAPAAALPLAQPVTPPAAVANGVITTPVSAAAADVPVIEVTPGTPLVADAPQAPVADAGTAPIAAAPQARTTRRPPPAGTRTAGAK